MAGSSRKARPRRSRPIPRFRNSTLEAGMAETRRSEANVLLQVRGLNVYYGHSHALQGVDLTLDHGVLSVVGRNGMGKTTLCKAILGLVRASSGTVRMRGQELLGLPPASIARHHVGYVPQGRRLWRSLTVDEHLRMTQSRERGAWTAERVYDTFPRLAERRNNGGAQLSGGEQQMLAISRALVTNPHLLIMDEPTEGLAPVIVAQVEEMLLRLGEETDMAILVIEQNIGVATTISENVAIMVNGRVNRIIESRPLSGGPPPHTARRAAGGHRGWDTRHQRRRAPLHTRSDRRQRVADAPCRRVDERQARDMRCDRTRDRTQPWSRRLGSLQPGPRRLRRRNGGSVRDLDQAPRRHRRHYQRGRLRRRLDRGPGDAGA